VIRFALGAFLAALSGNTRKIDVLGIDHFELGAIESVPLSFTDAAALPDGRVIFCAVAEDTDNAYDDGCCAGAAIGIIDRGKLCYLRTLDRPYKIEGVDARTEGDSIALLLVTDADNPDVPAELLSARLKV
jgi:hypothetical protein